MDKFITIIRVGALSKNRYNVITTLGDDQETKQLTTVTCVSTVEDALEDALRKIIVDYDVTNKLDGFINTSRYKFSKNTNAKFGIVNEKHELHRGLQLKSSYMDPKLFKHEKEFRRYMELAYYRNNDNAHQIDHADDVWAEFCKLAITMESTFKVDRRIVFYAVYMHDMFSGTMRKLHNTIAKDFILGIELADDEELDVLKTFSKDDLKLIADMVYYHRASVTIPSDLSNTTKTYVNLIRAADKGAPIFSEWLERSLKYHKGDIDPVKEVRKHFIEKFSEDGYAWKNDPTYKELYKDEYEVFQKELKEWLENV